MLKKVMLLSTVAATSLVLLSQAAQAQWYDNGVALVKGANPSLEATGTVAFTSPNGGVHCNSGTVTVQATGGTTTRHLLAYKAENTSACEVSGSLVFLTGGTTTVKDSKLNTFPSGTHNGSTIQISNFSLFIAFTNGFSITLSTIEGSPLVITPNNTTAVTSATSTGEMSSALGKVVITTSGNILGAASGTYGLVK